MDRITFLKLLNENLYDIFEKILYILQILVVYMQDLQRLGSIWRICADVKVYCSDCIAYIFLGPMQSMDPAMLPSKH